MPVPISLKFNNCFAKVQRNASPWFSGEPGCKFYGSVSPGGEARLARDGFLRV